MLSWLLYIYRMLCWLTASLCGGDDTVCHTQLAHKSIGLCREECFTLMYFMSVSDRDCVVLQCVKQHVCDRHWHHCSVDYQLLYAHLNALAVCAAGTSNESRPFTNQRSSQRSSHC